MLYIVTLLLLCHVVQGTFVVSWGSNTYGQLGLGNTTDVVFAPTQVTDYGPINIANLRIGLSTHFVMANDGSVYCSGNNIYGQLGINSLLNQNRPVRNSLANGLDVYPIGPQTIAFNSTTKDAFGWGMEAGYMLGSSYTGNQLTPKKSVSAEFAGLVIGVSTAWSTSFVLLNGGAYAAGKIINYPGLTPDTNAKLGINVTADTKSFTRMSFWNNNPLMKLFPSDSSHICGLAKNFSLFCWGKNNYGQLGLGHTNDAAIPNFVSFFDQRGLYVAQVKTGDGHTVALTCGGRVYVWGQNTYGNLGLGTSDATAHPNPILLGNLTHLQIVEITSSINTVYARNSTNHWHVWGAAANNMTLMPQSGDVLRPVYNPYFTAHGLTRIATNSKSAFALAWIDPNAPTSRSPDCPALDDECLMGTDNCAENTLCVDTERSYRCVCGAGFTGNGISPDAGGTGCNDINECDLNLCLPSASCDNQMGSYYCTCPPGYAGDGKKNGTGCVDINECTEGGWCPPNTDCANSIGSYSCVCSSGYKNIGTTPCGIICTDVDECNTQHSCGARTKCVNTVGGYNCTCQPGYSGPSCTDINECVTGGHNCALQSYCNNLPGAFACKCPPGFEGDGVSIVVGGVGCLDINECTNSTACDSNASCANAVGSYQCTCNAGYTGNGQTCTDINECASSPLNNCVAAANGGVCTNTAGSYTCGCKSGYNGNGVKIGSGCTDINECASGKCDALATCANSAGSYSCVCPGGYLGDGSICYTVNCSVGFYPNSSTTCAKCPTGSYNDQTNAAKCVPCPAGTYSAGIGKTSASTCLPCAKNTYALAGSSACSACPLGSTSNVSASNCTLCPAGQYGVQGSCKNCGTGMFSSSAGATDCEPCPAGTFANNPASTSCTTCSAGTFSAGRAASCSTCAAGKYASAPGSYYCKTCPPGTSTNGSPGSAECTPCAGGSFASYSGSPSCSSCSAGYYSMNGSDVCLACGPGSYQDTAGQTSCKLCSNWQFTDTIGATACATCYQGLQGEAEFGSKICLSCPPGSFRRASNPVCTPCYSGSASELAGQAQCSYCMGGFYARKCGQITCDPCAPGTFSSFLGSGQSNCPYCPYGQASFGTAYYCYF